MNEPDYTTLRCKADRHELCPTRPDTRCCCPCHWALFTDEDDR